MEPENILPPHAESPDWRNRLRHVAQVEVDDVVPEWLGDSIAQLLLLSASEKDGPSPSALELAQQISFRFEHQFDPKLLDALTQLNQSYGPMGVAMAAASLTNHEALAERMTAEHRPAPDLVQDIVRGGEEKVRMIRHLASALDVDSNTVSFDSMIELVGQLQAFHAQCKQLILVSPEHWLKLSKATGAHIAIDPTSLHSRITTMRKVLLAIWSDVGAENEADDDEHDVDDWALLQQIVSEEVKKGNDARAMLGSLCRVLEIEPTARAVQKYVRGYGAFSRGVNRLSDLLGELGGVLDPPGKEGSDDRRT
jgi:hypothetical protein